MTTVPGALTTPTVHDRPGTRSTTTTDTGDTTMTTITITDELRELARAVIAAEDRADQLAHDAAAAWCAGRWSAAADILAEIVELRRSASAIRAEVSA